MSDRFRKRTGCVFLVLCIAMCLIPLLFRHQSSSVRYRSGDRLNWHVSPVMTEINGTVNINTEGTEELIRLPGIGNAYASNLISERIQNGPFYYAEDLLSVSGIGPATLEKIRDMIDLSIEGCEN